MTDFHVGHRLSYADHRCTVRYIGPVASTKGDWLGVEWDDPTRGKNNGEANEIKYFSCRSDSPTAASFVRPSRPADATRSFVEALRYKYAADSLPVVQPGSSYQEPKAIVISGKEVEEVGFEKIKQQQAQLGNLRIAILDGLCIRPSPPKGKSPDSALLHDEIHQPQNVCPRLVELDVSRNLFEDWREVASICSQLPQLKSLRADGNRFQHTEFTDVESGLSCSAFRNVSTLGLDNTLLPWSEAIGISSLFPSLSTLSLAGNEWACIPFETPLNPLASTLTILNLEWNSLTTLTSLLPLATLPNLSTLSLKNNAIAATGPPPGLPKTSPATFPKNLTALDLSRNAITTWAVIDALPTLFPGLKNLRTSHNPLYSSLRAPDGKSLTPDDGHTLTIARLRDVQVLNYSPVTEKERLNAETWYLSLVAAELARVPVDDEEGKRAVLAANPRWGELCEEYGEPELSRKAAGGPKAGTLAAGLVGCRFYLAGQGFASFAADNEITLSCRKEWTTQLPRSLSVYAVLGLVGDAFELPPASLRLIWETGEEDVAGDAGGGLLGGMEDAEWDSDDEEVKGGRGAAGKGDRGLREVEIVAGTRALGGWVEGAEVVVRVELRERTSA